MYTVDCQYGAAAFLTNLRKHEDVSPDCLIICGTPSSYWYRLPSYFAETAEMFGDVGASGDAAPAVIRERLLALFEGEAASGLKGYCQLRRFRAGGGICQSSPLL